MSWIANAESGSSVRAKLNALMIPISSVTISSPVAYIDIALPTGYNCFELIFSQVAFSADDVMSGAVSADGGSTFANDHTNFDTYLCGSKFFVANAVGGAEGKTSSTNSLVTFSDPNTLISSTATVLASGEINIDPGSASRSFACRSVMQSKSNEVGQKCYHNSALATFSSTATIPPSLARKNLLRLLPYGNGDCNPPTSGYTFTSGAFALYGVPT